MRNYGDSAAKQSSCENALAFFKEKKKHIQPKNILVHHQRKEIETTMKYHLAFHYKSHDQKANAEKVVEIRTLIYFW